MVLSTQPNPPSGKQIEAGLAEILSGPEGHPEPLKAGRGPAIRVRDLSLQGYRERVASMQPMGVGQSGLQGNNAVPAVAGLGAFGLSAKVWVRRGVGAVALLSVALAVGAVGTPKAEAQSASTWNKRGQKAEAREDYDAAFEAYRQAHLKKPDRPALQDPL